MRFFAFDQNNSGGRYIVDDDVNKLVIVQATSAFAANVRAANIGLYFDGRGDCNCCGNRWRKQYDDTDATKAPGIYGNRLDPSVFCDVRLTDHDVVIYFADGTRKYTDQSRTLWGWDDAFDDDAIDPLDRTNWEWDEVDDWCEKYDDTNPLDRTNWN